MGLLKKSLDILGEYRARLPTMFFLLLSVSMLDIIGIGLIAPFISLVLHQGSIYDEYEIILHLFGNIDNFTIVLYFGIVLIIIFVIKGFLSFFVQRRILSLGYEIRESLIDRLIFSYQNMKYEDIVSKKLSTTVVNINTHVGLFVDAIFVPILRMIIEFMVIVGLIALMAFTNLLLVVGMSIILVTIIAVYFKYVKNYMYKYGRVMSKKEVDIIDGIRHTVGAFREIRLLGVEDYFRNDIRENVEKFGEAGVITRSLPLMVRYLIEASVVFFIVIIIIYMLMTSENNASIFTSLSIFAIGAIRLVPSVSQIGSGLANIKSGMYALHALHDALAITINENENKDDKINPNKSFETLDLLLVDYTYPNTNIPTLKGVNFTVNKGELVGVTGKSGSGKTTLMDVVLGMLFPTSGDLLVNGKSAKFNDDLLPWWHTKVAYIPQDIFLINGSIKENIALGVKESDIDYEKLKFAINMSSLNEVMLNEGSTGLDTKVGESGGLLSGGQRQRVAIARAIYSGRELIFMDEPTSALDEVTESEIISYINSIKGNVTIILVTHRLKTLDNFDKVYNISDGQVLQIR